MWLPSEASGRDDGGGESQCTDENSESPIERQRRDNGLLLVGVEMLVLRLTYSLPQPRPVAIAILVSCQALEIHFLIARQFYSMTITS